ncbi:His Kinase A (phospho-acceptor) domain-containing protein [Tindallia magadiensis]|uniref:histidine kinase n=1 Tax=Tindallia magadiensis TaxID=69895 RepID=A0A1I3AZ66_9FIRM|nr:HAMP domain-containing sensor histidine kinase [Tindallia magadiensis]SFH55220.1 His Kinase A (phospho-acceptor) domain-containing protein [Tindallia magadiensis]
MKVDLNQLKESNEFLNTLLNHITSLIFILDQQLRIQCVNGAVEESFGQDIKNMTYQIFGNAINCSHAIEENKDCQHTSFCDLCDFRKGLLKVLKHQIPTYKEKVNRSLYINDKKIEKTFVFTTRHIYYKNESMVMVVVDDITEIEEQRRELKEAISLKNKFLGTVTHDLRNPISAIQNVSWFLLDDSDKMTDEQRLFLKDIYEVSEYMSRLVDDLLEISRIESGKLELDIGYHDYAETIRESVMINQPLAVKKDIKMELTLSDKPLMLYYDRNKIMQVVNNLIGNAIKFSYKKTKISVKVTHRDRYLLTCVSDEGPGIPMDEIDQVFSEFSKLSTRPTENEKSTGLGLAIAKRIVDGHHGEIWVDSVESEGSHFFFSLPMDDAHK